MTSLSAVGMDVSLSAVSQDTQINDQICGNLRNLWTNHHAGEALGTENLACGSATSRS
jgi:hypothetical protein